MIPSTTAVLILITSITTMPTSPILFQSTTATEGKVLDLCPHAQAQLRLFEAERAAQARHREADTDTDVIHYLLEIEIIPIYSGPDVTAVEVAGVCTIDIEAATDGLTLFTIDLKNNLTVNSVSGNVTSWSRVGDTIEVTLDQTYNTGQVFQLAIDYQGEPVDAGYGSFRWWLRNDDLTVATLSEPFYARYWWPCKDSLDDKATMQMHVTVPDPLIGVSNGLSQGVETLTGGRTKYKWEETYPMITYLVSLACTNYERYDLSFEYGDPNAPATMPVPCYVYPEHWDYDANEPYSSYKTGCDDLPNMLEIFSAKYGLYPFINEKYGVVETGGIGGISASMEHQTISSMSRLDNFNAIMAHELAHQWWGDEVTCQTWYDIWLNEGFASYSESLYRELMPGGGATSYWGAFELPASE